MEHMRARIAIGISLLLGIAGCSNQILPPEEPSSVTGNKVAAQSTINQALQEYSLELLQNKVGAIVALDPTNGEILAMASSTGMPDMDDPSSPHYPLWNRCIHACYPAGTVFGLVSLLTAEEDGLSLTAQTTECSGYPCHKHIQYSDVADAIKMGCTAASKEAFLRTVGDSPAEGLSHWNGKVMELGFGRKIGMEIPNERGGYVMTAKHCDRIYGEERWTAATALNLAYGEGDLLVTPIQLANFCAILANRGYYYSPHLDRKLVPTLNNTSFSENAFAPIIEGMWKAVNSDPGTWSTAFVAHVDNLGICASAGQASNSFGEDNSVFIGFAPKDNPRIAIAVYIENGGFGASFAAPIGSLVIEKYLSGDISRKYLAERMKTANLMDRSRYKHQ